MISLGRRREALPFLELRIELFDLRSSLAVDRNDTAPPAIGRPAAGLSSTTGRQTRAAWRTECTDATRLAKVGGEGSNPFARSSKLKYLDDLRRTRFGSG